MDLERIRNMSDKELTKYLKMLGARDTSICNLCGKISEKILKIDNLNSRQTKQLCGLCDECYDKMLEFLNTYDLGWK